MKTFHSFPRNGGGTFKLLLSLVFCLLLSSSWAYSVMPSSSRLVKQQQHRVESKLYSQIVAEGSGSPCRIKVVGVGGGGGNAVNRMIEVSEGPQGVDMWIVNTDAQALAKSPVQNKLNIGAVLSRGLGAGGNPSIGQQAALESKDEILDMVSSTDLVFVTAGMGGGTGSGAAPIIAECAKSSGALTIGVVTKPFGFEGRKRMSQARDAIMEMKSKVDTLIVVSNDKLLQIVPPNTPVQDAFLVADDILRQGVVGISEIIVRPGLINVDFADVRTIMANAGTALMGIGQGKGKSRAEDAAYAAISSPLLDFPITKAKGIVFNVVGGSDLTLQEINAAAEVIYENVDTDANIIFGALIDERMAAGEVSITVLATGFPTDFFDGDDDGERVKFEQTRASPSNVVNVSSKPLRQPINTRSDIMEDDDDDEYDDEDEEYEEDTRKPKKQKKQSKRKVVKKTGFRAFVRRLVRKIFG